MSHAARVLIVLVFEALLITWVLWPIREGENTIGLVIAAFGVSLAAGALSGTFWVVLATIPPVIVSAPLPRPPDQDFLPLGLMLFLWPLIAAAAGGGVLMSKLIQKARNDVVPTRNSAKR